MILLPILELMKYNRILDNYFKKPVFWDVIIAILLTVSIILFFDMLKISIPSSEVLYDLSKDISTIGFTSAGFVLTFLTIIITFRSNSEVTEKEIKESNKIFDLFFHSTLYFETVRHFKNCVKILVIVSMSGFILKLFNSMNIEFILFVYLIFGLIIIVSTLWRCVLIIGKILALQKK
jgi:RsiW-degrading membrane proteinase PrsW (M82 family)